MVTSRTICSASILALLSLWPASVFAQSWSQLESIETMSNDDLSTGMEDPSQIFPGWTLNEDQEGHLKSAFQTILTFRNAMQSLVSINTSDWAQRQQGRKNFTFADLDAFARNTDMKHDAESFSGLYYLAGCGYHLGFHNSIYQVMKAGSSASNDELRNKLVTARDRTNTRLGAMRGDLADQARSMVDAFSKVVDEELETLSARTNPAGGGGGGAGGGAGAPTTNPGNASGAAAPTKPSRAPHLSPE